MKIWSKASLRMRITLLIALVLIIICTILTTISIMSAHRLFVVNISDKQPIVYDENNSMDNMNIKIKQEGKITEEMGEAIRIKAKSEFTYISLICAYSIAILGIITTYIIVGKALRPIEKLSSEIEEIDENNLFKKIERIETKNEISRLMNSFNHMIDKLEKAFINQKNFSANVAHELKTPLTAMIANMEVLQIDNNSTTVNEYKETIEDVLQRAYQLRDLVNDLLKMNTEVNMSLCEKINANEMIDEIINDFSQDINNKNLKIKNRMHNIVIYGEKILLHRAFSNIIHNAIRYNKEDGIIEISNTENEKTITITVYDTGIGIPKNQTEKIFEPFYCVDKSRSKQLGGSGLRTIHCKIYN